MCNFDKIFNDSKHELILGCIDYTLLNFVIEMLNMKVATNLSNKGLDMILGLLSKLLLKVNLIPRSTYTSNKVLHDLGLSYETNHTLKMIVLSSERKMKTLINFMCVRHLDTRI